MDHAARGGGKAEPRPNFGIVTAWPGHQFVFYGDACSGVPGAGLSFRDAAIRMRKQSRLIGRPLPRRAVGSTLLLKGLEADVAVILNARKLNACNLFVAMTRGSRIVTICLPTPVLRPQP
jgi:hypothetical protein